MRNKFVVITFLVIVGILSTGCLNMDVVTRISEDGSGTWELGIGIDDSFMAMFGGMEGMEGEGGLEMEDMDLTGDLLPGGAEEFTDEETGITFRSEERIVNGQEMGYVIAEIPDAESWASLETAFNNVDAESTALDDMAGGDDMGGDDMLATDDLTEDIPLVPTVEFTDEGVRVSFEGAAPSEIMGMEDMEGQEDMMMFFDMGELISVSYSIDLGGALTDHNGTIDSATELPVWILDWESTEPIEIFAEGSFE